MPTRNNCEIFISHSSANASIVEPIVDMLFDLFDFQREHREIMYTSSPDTGLDNWSNYNDTLRNALVNCKIVIVFLSSNYVNSKYCLYELGAIWGLDKQGFLIKHQENKDCPLPDITLARTYASLSDTCLDQIDDFVNKFFYKKNKIKETVTRNTIKKKAWLRIQQAMNNTLLLPATEESYAASENKQKTMESPLKWEQQQTILFESLIGNFYPFYSLSGKQVYISEDVYITKPVEQTAYYLFVNDKTFKKEHKLWLLSKADNSLIAEYPPTFIGERETEYHVGVLDSYAARYCAEPTFEAHSPYSLIEEESRNQSRKRRAQETRQKFLQKATDGTLTDKEKELIPFMFPVERNTGSSV